MDKPRLILTPVNEICVYDVMLLDGELITITKMSRGAQQTYIRYGDQRYAWLNNTRKYYAQTSLQTYARSPRGRELLGTAARSEQVTANPLRYRGVPELDDRQRRPMAQAREGCATSDHSDLVPDIQQSRASVRMTQGRHIKHGEQVAFDVNHSSFDGSRHININNAMIKIDPNRYYYVVNQLTK